MWIGCGFWIFKRYVSVYIQTMSLFSYHIIKNEKALQQSNNNVYETDLIKIPEGFDWHNNCNVRWTYSSTDSAFMCSSSRRLIPLFERSIYRYHAGVFFKNNKKKLVRSFTFRYIDGWWVVVFNATFNNTSVISWQSALLVEETEVPGENNRPVASFWQTLSHNVASRTPRHERDSNSLVVIGTGCIGSGKSNYHTSTATTAPI
jgi:hypothetical protein